MPALPFAIAGFTLLTLTVGRRFRLKSWLVASLILFVSGLTPWGTSTVRSVYGASSNLASATSSARPLAVDSAARLSSGDRAQTRNQIDIRLQQPETGVRPPRPSLSEQKLHQTGIDVEQVSFGLSAGAKPGWTEHLQYKNDGSYFRLVRSGASPRRRDCELALNLSLLDTTHDFVEEYLGPASADVIRFDLHYIKSKLMVPEHDYELVSQGALGSEHELFAQLEFDEEFQSELDTRWRHVQANQRIQSTFVICGGVLGLLATVFGYLRLDHATQGLHSGRLQFLAGSAILVQIAIAIAIWLSLPWI